MSDREQTRDATKINEILESILHDVMERELSGTDSALYSQTMWNMTNHTPSPDDIETIELLRTDFKVTAGGVIRFTPEGRERSLALTNLEQALMWAVAGIARKREEGKVE